MGELTFQIDLLHTAIGAAKRYKGNPYQRFLFVCGKLGIIEKQYRTSNRFTLAMWTRHVLNRVRAAGRCDVVMTQLRVELEELPHSNTGVNSDVVLNLPLFGDE